MIRIISLLFFGVFVCCGTVSATLINGGFETGDLYGWTSSGNVEVISGDDLPYGWQDTDEGGDPISEPSEYGYFISEPYTSFSPYEGNSMVKIGSHTADENWAVNNRLDQTLTGDYYLPELTFAFNMWSYDYGDFDTFQVGITDAFGLDYLLWEADASYVSSDSEPPTLDYSDWQELTFDLTPYLGTNASDFTIWFATGDTGDTAERTRTGVFLDGISVSSTPIPEPTTMLLLGAGLVGLAGFGCKRSKK